MKEFRAERSSAVKSAGVASELIAGTGEGGLRAAATASDVAAGTGESGPGGDGVGAAVIVEISVRVPAESCPVLPIVGTNIASDSTFGVGSCRYLWAI